MESAPRSPPKKLRILLVTEDLRAGGAQVFALRLARALHNGGHFVVVYTCYSHLIDHRLVAELAPEVPVLAFGGRSSLSDLSARKADGILRRLRIQPLVREPLLMHHLRRTLTDLRVNVVNSHTIKADYVASRAVEGISPKPAHVITMHGCYELFMLRTDEPWVTRRANSALNRAEGLVFLSDKNLSIFSRPGVRSLDSLPHRKIYNGIEPGPESYTENRAQLGIPNSDFVFGMIARGVPEKGWECAIQAFESVDSDGAGRAHLVLVGHSAYLESLRARTTHPRIHFVGHSPTPLDWVRSFDVGLLPTYYQAESLPNSVAEYLSCGKPVLATKLGEIPQMLASSEGPAGVLVELRSDERSVDLTSLTEGMLAYLEDPELVREHRRRATYAFAKFNMDECVRSYVALFEQSVQDVGRTKA